MSRFIPFVTICILCSIITSGFSQITYYSRAAGNWNVAATWSTNACGNVTNVGTFPQPTDNVVICHPITVNVSTVTINNLTINAGGLLNNTTATNFLISGTTAINGPATGIFRVSTGTPATVTFTGSVSGTGDIDYTTTVNHIFEFKGPTNSIGRFNPSNLANSTVRYTGLNQTMFVSANYRSLYVEFAVKTPDVPGTITVNQTLSIQPNTELNLGNATITLNLMGNVTIGGKLNLGGVVPKTVIHSTGTFSADTLIMQGAGLAHTFSTAALAPTITTLATTNGSNSAISYNGTAQSIPKKNEYQNLLIQGTTTKTFIGAGTVTINGNLQIQAGATLSLGATAVDVQVNGDLINPSSTLNMGTNGTTILRLGGANNSCQTLASSIATQTIDYNRAGPQQVFASNVYPSVTISNAGTKTLQGNSIIGGSLLINAGPELSVGSTASSVQVNGITTINGNFNFGNTVAKNISFMSDLTGAGTIMMNGGSLPHSLNLSGPNNSIGSFLTDDNSGSTVSYQAPSVNQSMIITANYQNVSLSGTGTKTIAGNIGIRGNLIVGAPFDCGSKNVDIRGNWTNNNTFTAGTGTVTFNGVVAQSIDGAMNPGFGNLAITNGSAKVSTFLTVTAVNTSISSASVLDLREFFHDLGTITGMGIIQLTSTGPVTTHPTSIVGSPFFNVGGGTLEFYGSNDYTMHGFTAYHVYIVDPVTRTQTDDIVLKGNIAIGAGATLNGSGFIVGLDGDWTQDGFTIAATGRFSGPTTQLISGTGPLSFDYLQVNNGGNTVRLMNSISVSAGLDFQTAGTIELGTNDLKLSSPVVITGAGATANVLTNGTGRLVREISGPASFFYPVMVASKYSPATLTISGANLSAGSSVGIRAVPTEAPAVATSGKSLNPFWDISTNLISNITGSFQFTYDNTAVLGTEAAYVGARYDGSSWTKGAPITVNTASNIVTFPYSSITSINGAYTAGEPIVFSFDNLYSIADANWETPGTWSYAAGGVSCGCTPTSSSVVHITGHTVTKSTATNSSIDTLYIDATGILDIPNYTNSITMNVFTNKGTGGNGTLRIGTSGFPLITTNDFCNAAGTGLGKVEFYGASYSFYPITIYPHLMITSGAKTVSSGTLIVLGDLTLSSAATLNLGATLTSMTVSGNTSVPGGNSLQFGSGSVKTLTNFGDFICAGGLDMNGGGHILELRGVDNVIGSLNSGTATIRYNSASAQNMSTFTNGYYNLEVAGGVKTLRSAAEVYGNLNMNGAVIDLAAYDLIIMNPATITGSFSATNCIRVSGTGTAVLNMTGATPAFNRIVPVATTTNYMPVTINLTAFTGGTGEIRIRPTNGVHPNSFAPAVSLVGYWQINSTGLTGISGSLTFVYQNGQVAGTEGIYLPGYYDGSSWTTTGSVTAATNTISITKSGVGTLTGGYTAGEPAAFTAATITTTNPSQTDYCLGDAIIGNFTISGTFSAGNNFVLELSAPGGGFPGTAIGSVSATTVTPINATLPAIAGSYRIRVNGTNPATTGSQSALFNINPAIASNTASTAQTFCASGDPAILTGSIPTGGNGTYFYQWENSTDGVIFNSIAGATTQNYDPPFILATTYYRRKVSSGGCGDISTAVVMTVNPALNAGSVDGSQSFCGSGNPVVFSELSPPSGGAGLGTYVFDWESGPAVGGPYTSIGGATSNTYDAPLTSTTTFFRRKVTSTASGCVAVYSSPVSVTITAPPTSNANVDQTKCASAPSTILSGSVTNAASFSWSGGTGTFAPNASTLTATYTPSAPEISAGTVTLTLNANGNAPCGLITDQMTITINAVPTSNANIDQTKCASAPAALLNGAVTNAVSFAWSSLSGTPGTFSPNATTLNATYTPSAAEISAGTTTLRLTSNNAPCTAITDDMVLTINAVPVVNAGTDMAICQPSAASITTASNSNSPSRTWSITSGPGGGSFSNATVLNPVFTPGLSGVYVLRLTANGNTPCTAVFDEMTLTVNPTPVANAGTDQSICGVAGVSLNGGVTGAPGGIWSGGGGTFTPNATTLNATYTPTAGEVGTTVNLTLTTSGGPCAATNDVVAITVVAPPIANAGPDLNVCQSNTANITTASVTNAATFSWSVIGGGTFSPSTTTLNPSYSQTIPGTYTLTLTAVGTAPCGNMADQLIVTVLPQPAITLGSNSPLCEGNIINLTASSVPAASVYSWTGPATFGSSAQNPSRSSATLSMSGNYTLTATTASGCSNSSIVSVIVNPLPAAPTASYNNPVCEGSDINLSASASANYSWSGPLGFNSTAQNPVIAASSVSNSGTYSVTTTVSGCTSPPGNVNVIVNPIPATPVITGSTTPCVGQNILYDVTDHPGNSYSWTVPAGSTILSGNGTFQILMTAGIGAGSVDVTETSPAGCASLAATLPITIGDVPAQPSLITGPAAVCDGISGNNYSVLFDGSSTYNWSYTGSGATLTPTVNNVTVDYNLATDGNLQVVAQNSCGTSTASVQAIDIKVVPAQPSIIGGNLTPCEGSSTNSYGVLFDPDATNYLWSYTGSGHSIAGSTNNVNVDFAIGATDGNMQVIAQNACGNSITRVEAIDVMNIPAQPALINSLVSYSICEGNSNTFTVPVDPIATQYNWSYTGSGASYSGTTNSILVSFPVATTSGVLLVYAQNVCGSSIPSQLPVTIQTVPVQPSPINGSTTQCENTFSQPYDVTFDASVTYNWTYSGTNTNISGATSNTPTLDFLPGATSGPLSVTATNGCGTSTPSVLAIVINTIPATPSAITGNGNPCANDIGQVYSVVNDPLAASYTWTYSGTGASFSSAVNVVSIDYTAATSGPLLVNAVNACGSSAASTLPINIKGVPLNPGAFLISTLTACQGVSYPYSVNNDPSADFYTWSYSGTGVTPSGTTNAESISFSPTATSGQLSVVAENVCGASTPSTLTITVQSVPVQPSAINGSASQCENTTGMLYDVTLDPLALSYNWSYSGTNVNIAGGTTNTPSLDFLAGATGGTLSVIAVNSCGNSSASTLAVAVGTVPATPSPIVGNANPCDGATGVLYNVTNDPLATSYNWSYSGSGSTISGGTTNAVSIDFVSATSGTLQVQAINACGASFLSSVPLAIKTIPINPGVFTTSTLTPCQGANYPYSVNNDPNADFYTWSYSGTGATPSGTTNAESISFGPTATSGQLSVVAENVCGASTPSTLTITVQSVPAQPSAINGSASQCENTTGMLYDVTLDPLALSYNWSYSGTNVNIAGGTTNTPSLDFLAGATGGTLSVAATNSCGTSPSSDLPITIQTIPVAPVSITGNTTPCINTVGNMYAVANDPNATSYNWTYAGIGATLTGTTNTVSVDFSLSAGSGTLQVSAINGCGASGLTPLSITMKSSPVNPGIFTTSTLNVCQNSVSNPYAVISDPNADFYTWSYTGTGATPSGTTNAIWVAYSTTATSGTLSVVAENTCGTSSSSSVAITVDPIPAQPTVVTGPADVCEGMSGLTYSVTNDPVATGYSYNYTGTLYNLTPGSAPFNSCVMDFLTGATSGTLSITASNACGNSPSSDLIISVHTIPAQPTGFSGLTSVCTNSSGNPYTVANDLNASSYTWTYSGTGATISGSTSAVAVDFNASATNGSLDVFAVNMCGNSTVLSTPISIAPSPSTALALDGAADTVCINTNASLTIIATEPGVTYQAFVGATPIGTSVSGDGTDKSISLPYIDLANGANTITIEATSTCLVSSTLTNSKTIHKSSHNSSLPIQVSASSSLCTGGTVTYGISPTAGYSYKWFQGTREIIGSTNSVLDILVPGSYTLEITDNYKCIATSTAFSVAIGVTSPFVSLGSSTGTSAQFSTTVPGGANIQWFAVTLNGNKRIQGETSANYTAYYDGQYYVVAAMNGCFVPSNLVSLGSMVSGSLERHMLNVDNETINLPVPDFNKELSFYPNPSSGSFSVNYIRTTEEITTFELYNQQGILMYSQNISGSGLTITDISVPGVTSGLYQIIIREGDKKTHSTIMME